MPDPAQPWPLELRSVGGGKTLRVSFDEGSSFDLPAEYLRVESPSAEVRGHSPSERKLVHGKAQVAIRDIVPTGNYAVRIVFDDGHDTGIYTWTYLMELGREQAARWGAHLAELRKAGLSR